MTSYEYDFAGTVSRITVITSYSIHYTKLYEPHDSPITRILSRPVSRAMTRLFLATPITPNQITIFSFLLGLAAAFCFLEGSRAMSIAGGVLLVFSTWVDGVDSYNFV